MATVLCTGDVMLGRKVGEAIEQNGARHVWGDALSLIQQADATVANLECVIGTSGEPEPGRTFHFRAPLDAVRALELANVQVATLANNHALDFGGEALLETLDRLDDADIARTGAGRSYQEAASPVRFSVDGVEVGILATTDNVPSWDIERRTPGVTHARADPDAAGFDRLRQDVHALSREVPIVIVSSHWGPNMIREPPKEQREAAHALLEAGADVVWSHSAHLFQGIERSREGLIIHDAGDTVNDYRIDPEERNDIGFLFFLEVRRGRPGRLRLEPIRIDPRACQVKRADASAAAWARDRMRELCRPYGTKLVSTNDGLAVPVPGPEG